MAEPLSLGQLGRVLLRYWILIVIGTLVGGALAFGVTRFMTPVYRATAIQLVKGLPGTGAAANYEAAQYAVSRAKTYPSFVHSQQVLEGVRSDLNDSESIVQLREDLSAANPVDTPLLEITASAETPEEARDKANYAARHMARFITEIETVGNRSPITVETAVLAALPTQAASPKTLVIAALGAMIGFALTTIFAMINSYVRYQRRSAFRRKQAIDWITAEATDQPAAATAAADSPAPAAADSPAPAADSPAPPPQVEPLVVAVASPPSRPDVEVLEVSVAAPEARPATPPEPEVPAGGDLVPAGAKGDDLPSPAGSEQGHELHEFLIEVDPDPTTLRRIPAFEPRDPNFDPDTIIIFSADPPVVPDDSAVGTNDPADIWPEQTNHHEVDSAEQVNHREVESAAQANHHVIVPAGETNHHADDPAEETNHHPVTSAEQVDLPLVASDDHDASAEFDEGEAADLHDSAEDDAMTAEEREELDALEPSGTGQQSARR